MINNSLQLNFQGDIIRTYMYNTFIVSNIML